MLWACRTVGIRVFNTLRSFPFLLNFFQFWNMLRDQVFIMSHFRYGWLLYLFDILARFGDIHWQLLELWRYALSPTVICQLLFVQVVQLIEWKVIIYLELLQQYRFFILLKQFFLKVKFRMCLVYQMLHVFWTFSFGLLINLALLDLFD